jgi:hypothetical protein
MYNSIFVNVNDVSVSARPPEDILYFCSAGFKESGNRDAWSFLFQSKIEDSQGVCVFIISC